jgi:hypothetical protein
MYARKLATLAIGALGIAVAALAGDPWKEGWSFSAGEYQARCASCHGVSGTGDGPMAHQLQLRMPDLTTYARRNGGAFPTQLAWLKIDGRPASLEVESSMPCWGWELRHEATSMPHPASDPERYVATEISALVEHLKSMQVE